MEFSLDTFIISIINILVTFVVLRKLVYKPVFNYLKQRSERIETDLKKADNAALSISQAEKTIDSEITEAKQKADEILKQSMEEAQTASKLVLERANSDAKRILEEANVKAEMLKDTTLKNMQDSISDIASEIAKNILKRELSQADNLNLVNEYFDEVKGHA